MRPKWEIKETIIPDISFGEALNKIKNILLHNRGINSIEELNSSLDVNLYDPFLLPDMEIAVARISKSINNQEIIGILIKFPFGSRISTFSDFCWLIIANNAAFAAAVAELPVVYPVFNSVFSLTTFFVFILLY